MSWPISPVLPSTHHLKVKFQTGWIRWYRVLILKVCRVESCGLQNIIFTSQIGVAVTVTVSVSVAVRVAVRALL